MFKYFNKIYPNSEQQLPKVCINDFGYHKLDLNELVSLFRTDALNGLSAKFVKLVQAEMGSNSIRSSNSAIYTKMFQNFFPIFRKK